MEWKRVLYNPKSICIMFFFLLLNGIAFEYYLHNSRSEYTVENEEYEYYIKNYQKRIDNIIENKERLSAFSVFRREDSFAWNNIVKTEKDYRRVQEIQPVLLENQGVSSLFCWGKAPFFMLAFGIWIVLLFVAEKKDSMELLVHTYRNGRGKLFVRRFITLFLGMTVFALLLYSGMFYLMAIEYGVPPLQMPIQSLPQMESIVFPCSISQFLIMYFGIHVLGCMVTVMLFWFVLQLFQKTGLGICFYLLILTMEYILFTGLSLQSDFCLLRYLNFYFSLDLSELWNIYFNVPVGDYAISNIHIYICFLIISFSLLFVFLYIESIKKFPIRAKSILVIRLEKLMSWVRKKMVRLPILFWEVYKLLWCQKGILFIILFIWIMWGTIDHSAMFFSPEQEYANAFFEVNAGPLTEEKWGNLKKDERLGEYSEYVAQQLAEGHSHIWIVNERGFKVLADEKGGYDGVLAIICLLLLVSGCIAYEKKREMMPLLRGGKCGQRYLYRQKQISVHIITLVVWAVMNSIEWRRVSIHYPLNCLQAPVQSLPFMANMTLSISIGFYMLFIAVSEWIVLHLFSSFVMIWSAVCKKVYIAILISLTGVLPVYVLESIVTTTIYTTKEFYFRCILVVTVLIIDVVFYMIGALKWSQRRRC